MNLLTRLYVKLKGIDLKKLDMAEFSVKSFMQNNKKVCKNLKKMSDEIVQMIDTKDLHDYTCDRIDMASQDMVNDVNYLQALVGDEEFANSMALNNYYTKIFTYILLDINNTEKDEMLLRDKMVYRYDFLSDYAIYSLINYYVVTEQLVVSWNEEDGKLTFGGGEPKNRIPIDFVVRYVRLLNEFYNAVCEYRIADLGSLLMDFEIKNWFEVEYEKKEIKPYSADEEDIFE